MKLSFDSASPVYLQISNAIEDDIIYGKLKEGQPAYSQLIIAKELNVNPATAAKGINLLVQKGILQKQRGLSMIVAEGAVNALLKEKRENSITKLVKDVVTESKKLQMTEDELIRLIKNNFREENNHE